MNTGTMKIDPNELDDDVINDIVANLGLDPGEEDTYVVVSNLTVNEAFDRYLKWNGIIGYSSKLIHALDSIRASLRPVEISKEENE